MSTTMNTVMPKNIRNPTPLDKQTKVQAGRFISAQVIDNDHYCPAVSCAMPAAKPLQ